MKFAKLHQENNNEIKRQTTQNYLLACRMNVRNT